MNSDLFVVVPGGALVLLVVIYSLRFLYGYRLANCAVEIILFRALPVYRIPVRDIELIQKASWRKLGIGGTTLRLGNRLARECVLIQKRTGLIRRIVITPDDADRFISQVNASRQGHPGAGRNKEGP